MRSSRLVMIKKRQASKDSNATTIGFDTDLRNPHFFKIIVSPLTQKSKLKIPAEFVKKYGNLLSDDIYLNIPNSEQPWEVELEKDSSDVHLVTGWREFMEFYCLGSGHFLVFRLDGGSHSRFHVLIFDKSATEIDYPVRSSDVTKGSTDSRQHKMSVKKVQIEEADDDVSLEMLDENSPKLNKSEPFINLDSSDSDDDVECSSFKGKGHDVIPPAMRKKLNSKLDGIDSQRPHFKSIMYPSHVLNRWKLNVPFSHASIHFPRDKSEKIILKGPNGKSHNIRFYVEKRFARLLGGWKFFVLDNKLKIGDICLFELVKRQPNSYKVSIFRR